MGTALAEKPAAFGGYVFHQDEIGVNQDWRDVWRRGKTRFQGSGGRLLGHDHGVVGKPFLNLQARGHRGFFRILSGLCWKWTHDCDI